MQQAQRGEVLPRLTTRAAVVTEVGFLAVGVAIFTLIWVAGPWLWWLAAPVIAVLGYGAAVLLTSATWVDAAAGTLTRRGWRLVPRTVRLAGATTLRVSASGGGGARLVVRTGDGTVVVELASISLFASRSLPAPTLELLADALAGHVPPSVIGDVPGRLRDQARHIAGGGSVETAPLSTRP